MSFSGLLFIMVFGLLVFGPKKSLEIAKQIGRAVGELKRVSSRFQSQLEDELKNPKIANSVETQKPTESFEPFEINVSAGVDMMNG